MFNTILNHISAISWQSVLLVEEIGVPGETHSLPQVTDIEYTSSEWDSNSQC